MNCVPIKDIVIVGGGTAGWMTAAALSKVINQRLNKQHTGSAAPKLNITLVESDAIGTVGVGEATVPHIRYFNQMLGIDEADFMACTQATYKLGIELINWGAIGRSYIHPFSVYGIHDLPTSFHHYWVKKHLQQGESSIEDYSLGAVAARQQKFAYPSHSKNIGTFGYAFHLDASLYAQYLRKYSEALGVKRVEGKVNEVEREEGKGIAAIVLESGARLEADLFIDCSGFKALLIGNDSEFENWSQWLKCDRAVAVASEAQSNIPPYTKAEATSCGWKWKIPLQQRTGNGLVYSSQYMDEESAYNTLKDSIKENVSDKAKFLSFVSGVRPQSWKDNCVAIGLSSGFLEPLESTSIYLIQAAIMKLIDVFPVHSHDTLSAKEFNRSLYLEYLRVRDFLILHYKATERSDSKFWQDCRQMEIPESLQQKITLFRDSGQVESYSQGMFKEPSWVALYLGQGIIPESYHPLVDALDDDGLTRLLRESKSTIQKHVDEFPTHTEFLHKKKQLTIPELMEAAPLNLYGRAATK